MCVSEDKYKDALFTCKTFSQARWLMPIIPANLETAEMGRIADRRPAPCKK